MSMPINVKVAVPVNGSGAIIVGNGARQDMAQYSNMGYDFVRAGADDWVGDIEASVAGLTWDTIASLAASGAGAIGDHYQFVRIAVSDAGSTVLGAATKLHAVGTSV